MHGSSVLILLFDQRVDDILFVAVDADLVEFGPLLEDQLLVVRVGGGASDESQIKNRTRTPEGSALRAAAALASLRFSSMASWVE